MEYSLTHELRTNDMQILHIFRVNRNEVSYDHISSHRKGLRKKEQECCYFEIFTMVHIYRLHVLDLAEVFVQRLLSVEVHENCYTYSNSSSTQYLIYGVSK